MNLSRVYPPDRLELAADELEHLRAKRPPAARAWLQAEGGSGWLYTRYGLQEVRAGRRMVRIWPAPPDAQISAPEPWEAGIGWAATHLFPRLEQVFEAVGSVLEAVAWADAPARLLCQLGRCRGMRYRWWWMAADTRRFHPADGGFTVPEGVAGGGGPVVMYHCTHAACQPQVLVRLDRAAILQDLRGGWPDELWPFARFIGCGSAADVMRVAGGVVAREVPAGRGFGRMVEVA